MHCVAVVVIHVSLCLSAATRSSKIVIVVNHRLISWLATFRCYVVKFSVYSLQAHNIGVLLSVPASSSALSEWDRILEIPGQRHLKEPILFVFFIIYFLFATRNGE